MIVDMIGSAQPLTRDYDVALLDLDGVVYLGEQAIPNVPAALASVRAQGMRLAFVTNNASRTPRQVADLLSHLGVDAQPTDVITSSHAAAHFLADRLAPGAPVLVLGTTGLIDAITERGLRPVFSADDSPVAVVQGFSPDLNWHALAEGMVAIRRGARWVATNLDPSVPSPRGPLPGNGALVAALRHATGTAPESTGKPDPTMHAESVLRSNATHPIVVGDRLDTDIEGAKRADCASLLVLTGVTTASDLLAAQPLHRPDFLGHDVSALLQPHPPVRTEGLDMICGSSAVRTDHTRLIVTAGDEAGGDGLDVLRVLAAGAWQMADHAGAVPQIATGDDLTSRRLAELGIAHGRTSTNLTGDGGKRA
jgi:glycerol 3-phosphatase-2